MTYDPDPVQNAIIEAAIREPTKTLIVREREPDDHERCPPWVAVVKETGDYIMFGPAFYGGDTREKALEDARRIASKWGWKVEAQVVHELKTWPDYFEAVADGRKTFEVRRLGDRPVAVGDHLRLCEWRADGSEYTGREVTVEVTYLADLEPVTGCPLIGMSIRPVAA